MAKNTVLIFSDKIFQKTFVYDISDSFNPESLGVIDDEAYVIEDLPNTTYIIISTKYDNGDAAIYDLSDPSQVSLVSYVGGGGHAKSIETKYPYLYMGFSNWGGEIYIYNISDYFSPLYVEKFTVKGEYSSISSLKRVSNTYLLSILKPTGESILYDVENPTIPTQKGMIDLGSEAYKLVCYDKYAYIAAGGGGLKIVRITE